MNIIAKIKNKIEHPVLGEIWCLHRVLPERSRFGRNKELEITPRFLQEKIEAYQRDGFRFCSIDEIYSGQLFRYRFPWMPRFVNISFDDGFSDVYEHAFPVFKKYAIPFTLYLTTDFPEKKAFIWWLMLEKIILDHDAVEFPDGTRYPCSIEDDKQRLFEESMHLIYHSGESAPIFFTKLFGKYIGEYASMNEKLALSWSQILEMLDSGLCTLGSHSATHPDFRSLSYDEILKDIQASVSKIKEKTKKDVFHFSYPHSFRTDNAERAVVKLGMQTAAMGYGGSVKLPVDGYCLPRNYIVEPE